MSKDFKQLLKLYEEFKDFMGRIHGLYLDSLIGFEVILTDIEKKQNYIKDLFKNDDPMVGSKLIWDAANFSHEHVFANAEHYFKKKGQGKSYAGSGMHDATLGEIKRRNDPNGDNCLFLGNMCIVMLYSYWEHYLRKALTKALGETKSINVPIWGDLKLLRHSIIHNKGKAASNITKAEILRWYQPKDKIFINQEKFRDVILILMSFGNWIHKQSLPTTVIRIPKHRA